MNKLQKKTCLILIIYSLTCWLTGCWDYQELKQLAVVMGIAIDKAEDPDKILITFQVLVPQGLDPESGNSPTFLNISSTGTTVMEAIRNCTAKLDRRLYFPFNEIIIFSHELAEEGIAPYLDFFVRDPNPRIQIWLAIAQEQAHDLLEKHIELENIPARALSQSIARQKGFLSKIPAHYVDGFAHALQSKTRQPVAPILEVLGAAEQKEILIKKTAVFQGDKIISTLNREESRGLLWVSDEIKSGIIVVEDPNQENKLVSLEIIDSHSKTSAEIIDEQMKIKIEISMESNLLEQQGTSRVTDPKNLALLEKRQATVIRNEITAVLQKAQDLKIDIFGFGDEFIKLNPKFMEAKTDHWEKYFPEIQTTIEVKSKIRRSGFLDRPVKIR